MTNIFVRDGLGQVRQHKATGSGTESDPLSLSQGLSFLSEVKLGNIPGYSIVNKFGRNSAVPNGDIKPVCVGGVWPTPTALTTLEILSDDAADDAAGIGARKVRVYGIVAGYAEGSTDVELDGTTPVEIDTDFYRVTRLKVLESGTYATAATSSQQGTITVRESGGGATWAQIDEAVSTFGVGQSQIGCTTIPAGYTGLLLSKKISVDSGKSAKVYFFTRENIDTIAAPFNIRTVINPQVNSAQRGFREEIHPYPAPACRHGGWWQLPSRQGHRVRVAEYPFPGRRARSGRSPSGSAARSSAASRPRRRPPTQAGRRGR